jgi:hypothetical protein
VDNGVGWLKVEQGGEERGGLVVAAGGPGAGVWKWDLWKIGGWDSV